jgi:hypothetical protein
MIVNEGTLQLVPIRGGGPHSIEIGTPSSAYDVGAGRVWVAYPDGTLKRFGLNGEPAGRPLDLGGKPVDVQPGKDRAWVLIEKGDGKKELLDVRP